MGLSEILIIIAIGIFIIALLVIIKGYYNTTWFEVNNVMINQPKLSGLKILFFSDLHLGKLRKFSSAKALIEKIDLDGVDVVIFGGDLIGKKIKKYFTISKIKELFLPFLSINTRIIIMGNHETKNVIKKMSKEEIKQYLLATGFKLLRNEGVTVEHKDGKVNIFGLEETHRGKPSFAKASEKIEEADYNICLIHQPDYFDVLLHTKTDLVLSGHSHGGQIKLFNKRVFVAEGSGKYVQGTYQNGDKTLIVSKGIGNNGVKIRLFANQDIYYITFK